MLATRTLKAASWTVSAVATALALGSIGLEIVGPSDLSATADPEASAGGLVLVGVQAVVAAAFTVLGAIVVSRQPRNPIGWLLELIGLSFATIGIGNEVYLRVILPGGDVPGLAAYVIWAGNWAWLPAFVPAFTFLPLLFPTGRPLSPRWRPLVWMAALGVTVSIVAGALRSGPLDGAPAVDNPFGIDHPAVALAGSAGFGLLVPVGLASIAGLVVRFRRSTGVERQQLKWVAAAAASLPLAFAAGALIGDAAWPLMLVALLVVAAAMAVAVLRYRLYDVDVVINRALVYSALTATLALAYVGSVLVLQFVLRPVTQESELAVAGSTLAVAALFRPARSRIGAWVDQRFYRSRYDAARTLEVFGVRLREQLDLEALSADLRVVVRQTVQPAHVSIWLRDMR